MYSTILYVCILIVSLNGFVLNVITSIYAVQNMNLTIHVFLLVFIEAFSSALSMMLNTGLNIGYLFNHTDYILEYCTSVYLALTPIQILASTINFSISAIRYFITFKASRNIHLSNKLITVWSLIVIMSFLLTIVAVIFYGIYFDIPYSNFVEFCSSSARVPRKVQLIRDQFYKDISM